MKIEKMKIVNFKCFKGEFSLKLNEGINIIVGNNESGKSTVLEAIHLALTGLFNGRYLKNELTQYLFNREVVEEYLDNIANDKPAPLPYILIEIYIKENFAEFEGNGNSERTNACGLSLKIDFDEKYQSEYTQFIENGNIKSLPIEYYEIFWTTFARDSITSRSIPIKSALIDSSSYRYQNGSDIYISRIIRDNLETNEIIRISQAHRAMRDNFMDCEVIKQINDKIATEAEISNKTIELSVELLSKNAWESSLITYVDKIPFHFVGKGEQCIIKTKLALTHKRTIEANFILLEEPENHLTHSRLNHLIYDIKRNIENKQIIITTHSSFVANKLGLDNLVLLNRTTTTRFDELPDDTKSFFEKIAGYDTLRLILCNKAILVEGPSDELIIQKAYMNKNNGVLPIENEIDVISVGTSFLRFLEIAEKCQKPVVVVTDNDGDIEALNDKYKNYLGDNAKDFIKICFDENIDTGDLESEEEAFNYNTLEPKLANANNLKVLNEIFNTCFDNKDDLHRYMNKNKTKCALEIFNTDKDIIFPNYIMEAIRDNE
jgi:putative ATP-dependent endonuclease of OLD family